MTYPLASYAETIRAAREAHPEDAQPGEVPEALLRAIPRPTPARLRPRRRVSSPTPAR